MINIKKSDLESLIEYRGHIPHNVPSYEHPHIKDSLEEIEFKPRFVWHIEREAYTLTAVVGIYPSIPVVYGKNGDAYLNLEIEFTISQEGVKPIKFAGNEHESRDSIPDMVLNQYDTDQDSYELFLSTLHYRNKFFKDSEEVVNRAYLGFLSTVTDIVDMIELGGYTSIYIDIDKFIKYELELIK